MFKVINLPLQKRTKKRSLKNQIFFIFKKKLYICNVEKFFEIKTKCNSQIDSYFGLLE